MADGGSNFRLVVRDLLEELREDHDAAAGLVPVVVLVARKAVAVRVNTARAARCETREATRPSDRLE
jgi:hypothetical protein